MAGCTHVEINGLNSDPSCLGETAYFAALDAVPSLDLDATPRERLKVNRTESERRQHRVGCPADVESPMDL